MFRQYLRNLKVGKNRNIGKVEKVEKKLGLGLGLGVYFKRQRQSCYFVVTPVAGYDVVALIALALFSKNWPSGIFFFICSLRSLRSNAFLPPLPDVRCPNFLDFQNSLRKVMESSGLRFENFCS